tara:strand:- start:2765 stop:2869 length:105 start_codon:yes stop_codon:yes gene_type:complete
VTNEAIDKTAVYLNNSQKSIIEGYEKIKERISSD